MKRIIIFLFLISTFSLSYAANVEKTYKKYIENYDVANEAKLLDTINPFLFWKTALENNVLCNKFLKDIQKNKGAEKEALRRTAELPRLYPQYDESIVESMQGFCDTLLMNMGIRGLGYNCSLHIVYSDEVNAFSALTEDGFALCITTGLFVKKNLTYSMLMGYVAHEFAHGALFHVTRQFYAEAKERRKNELLGGIAATLNVATAGIEAYNAGAYGIPTSGNDYGAIINNIQTDIIVSTLKYSFQYSREQEIEADLFAYRFLEHLGVGEDYIRGLMLLGTSFDNLYNEYSDHPTITDRINFLRFVQTHPELGNKHKRKSNTRDDFEEFYW